MNSNLHLNGFLLPIGAMNLISILPLLLLAPLMECITSCYLSMEKTPFSPARVISRHAHMAHTHGTHTDTHGTQACTHMHKYHPHQ